MSTAITMDEAIELTATDATGQQRVHLRNVAVKATIGELARSLISRLGLMPADADGKPLTWRVRLDREGRSLHGSELIGEALKPKDRISLYPFVAAGAGDDSAIG